MFRYTVTDADYVKMAKWMLMHQRGEKKTAVFRLLLATLIQGGAVLWYLLSHPDTKDWIRTGLIILSVLWAALGIYRYFFTGLRARLLLNRVKSQNPGSLFWKEHCLSLREDRLVLTYSREQKELPLKDLSGVEHFEGLALVLEGRSVFDPVPEKIAESGQWKEFEEKILALAARKKEEEFRKAAEELKKDAAWSSFVQLSREEVAERLADMKKKSLFCRAGWSPLMLFNLIFPIAAAVYFAIAVAWLPAAACLPIFILLNWNVLSVFLPGFQKKQTGKVEAAGEDGYFLSLEKENVRLLTLERQHPYRLSALKRALTDKGRIYLIFEDQRMLFVPEEAAQDFAEALRRVKGIRQKAGSA